MPASKSRPRSCGPKPRHSTFRASSPSTALERERASLERTLESLHRDCAREIIPIQLPIGEERGFTGVVDLVRMKALTFAADGSGKMTEGDVPAALVERAHARARSS